MSAALLLSSCGLYNKYERPTVDTEGLIRDPLSPTDTLAVAPQDTASFGNLPWRSVFTDPQLQQLIEQGLERNSNLLNAALTVQIYESMLKAAKLAFLPGIALGSQQPMGTIATLHTSPSVETKSYSIPVSASWRSAPRRCSSSPSRTIRWLSVPRLSVALPTATTPC